jgi:hypothetical protein
MSEQFPNTLRLLRTERGWGWLILSGRNPEWPFRPEDIVDGSHHCAFATPQEAVADAEAKTGGNISPNTDDYRLWLG